MTGATESPARVFVDTNVWLYAFIASQDMDKHAIARELVTAQGICISAQVINEVSVNLLKKTDFTETALCRLIHAFYAGIMWFRSMWACSSARLN